jgi:hypothetical protein
VELFPSRAIKAAIREFNNQMILNLIAQTCTERGSHVVASSAAQTKVSQTVNPQTEHLLHVFSVFNISAAIRDQKGSSSMGE